MYVFESFVQLTPPELEEDELELLVDVVPPELVVAAVEAVPLLEDVVPPAEELAVCVALDVPPTDAPV